MKLLTSKEVQKQDELLAAAESVVERWETPLWKDVPATADYIARLRQAVEAVKEEK